MPAALASTRKMVIPSCLRVGWRIVRVTVTMRSATWAFVVNIFWPLRTKWSPQSSANNSTDAASEPTLGSLSAKAIFTSPETTLGRNSCLCASVP